MNADEIRRAVDVLYAPSDVFELRVIYKGERGGAASGYFDNTKDGIDKLITIIQKHETDPNVSGIYTTINPVLPALLSARK